jgi:hypothetical protein
MKRGSSSGSGGGTVAKQLTNFVTLGASSPLRAMERGGEANPSPLRVGPLSMPRGDTTLVRHGRKAIVVAAPTKGTDDHLIGPKGPGAMSLAIRGGVRVFSDPNTTLRPLSGNPASDRSSHVWH